MMTQNIYKEFQETTIISRKLLLIFMKPHIGPDKAGRPHQLRMFQKNREFG